MCSLSTWTEKELEEGDWRTLALQRMAKVLRTHVIKFDFENGKTIEKGLYVLLSLSYFIKQIKKDLMSTFILCLS